MFEFSKKKKKMKKTKEKNEEGNDLVNSFWTLNLKYKHDLFACKDSRPQNKPTSLREGKALGKRDLLYWEV